MSAQLMEEQIATTAEVTHPATGVKPAIIRTDNLWKTYTMGSEQLHALRGVSFEIQRNEYVAIMGP